MLRKIIASLDYFLNVELYVEENENLERLVCWGDFLTFKKKMHPSQHRILMAFFGFLPKATILH